MASFMSGLDRAPEFDIGFGISLGVSYSIWIYLGPASLDQIRAGDDLLRLNFLHLMCTWDQFWQIHSWVGMTWGV